MNATVNNNSNEVTIKLSHFANGDDNVIVETTQNKDAFVKGFQALKKSCNLLTFDCPNTLFTLDVNGFEIDFYGGKFAPKTSFFIDLLSEKIAPFTNDKKDLKKELSNYLLKDKDIFETVEFLNKLETLTKNELKLFAIDKKVLFLTSKTASNE